MKINKITVHCSSDLSFDGWWWLWLFFIFFWWLWWWNWTLRCLCPGDPSSGGPLPWQERMQGQFFNQYYLSKLTKSINIKSSHYWQLFSKVTASPNLLAAAPCTGLHIYLKLVPALFTFVLIVHTCISCFRYILYYIVHYSLYYFQRFVQRTIYFHLRTIIVMCFFLHILCPWHLMFLTYHYCCWIGHQAK